MSEAPLAYRRHALAEKLGVSVKTIDRAIADGRLRTSHRLGVTLILADSVDALLKPRERLSHATIGELTSGDDAGEFTHSRPTIRPTQ